MGEEGLRYDAMVEQALRGVVRRALSYAAERGLPGDHHFYISFRTNDPGVDIPAQLRSRYPNEMTIVLQHQFWGLDVGEEAFGVTLSFSDVPERLTIPFSAISAFADPSVRFGLQFDSGQGEGGDTVTPVAAPEQRQRPAEPIEPAAADNPFLPVEAATRRAKAAENKGAGEDAGEDEEAPADDRGGKVIMLDPYRKK
ncbi:MAG: ClpXP protease specificity-enhancing factor SspB [Kiloniellales bacterium]|nr:ClpXP protease specificity-enhancing factor SspB [Kiloniellales bacterium]